MRISQGPSSNRTHVVVLTADPEFDRSVRTTFGASNAIDLTIVSGRTPEHGDSLDIAGATVIVVDLDAGRADEMQGLARLTARPASRSTTMTVAPAISRLSPCSD